MRGGQDLSGINLMDLGVGFKPRQLYHDQNFSDALISITEGSVGYTLRNCNFQRAEITGMGLEPELAESCDFADAVIYQRRASDSKPRFQHCIFRRSLLSLGVVKNSVFQDCEMSEIVVIFYTPHDLETLVSCFELEPLWWSRVSRLVYLTSMAYGDNEAFIKARNGLRAGGLEVEFNDKILQQLPKWGSTTL